MSDGLQAMVVLPCCSLEIFSYDSTAGLSQTLRTRRPLVGGLSFQGVSGLCTNSLAHRLPEGTQAQGIEKAANAGLGLWLWESDSCM